MPTPLIWALIAFGAFAVVLIVFFAARDKMNSRLLLGVKIGLVALLVLAVSLTLGSSYNYVGTKQVGIPTSFGKTEKSVGSGLHWLAPWKKMNKLDGAIQTDSYEGKDVKDTTPCTTARIAHQSLACVDVTIRWRIQPNSADRLYKDYREFDRIRDSLVTRRLNAAVNEVFKDIDPLATDKEGNTATPSNSELADQVEDYLRSQIQSDIEVMDITIPVVRFDPKTQDRIDAFQAEVANTRIAEQKKRTAEATAAANRILAGSVSKDPNVLVADCLDTLRDMVKQKQTVPAGFNCWPGSQSALVVPSTR